MDNITNKCYNEDHPNTEAIYYYVSLCNIMNKESKINEIIKSIIILYDLINSNNSYNINYISDLKSFYVFIFFLEKINSLISAVIRIEDLENFSNITNSFLSEDCLLSKNFLMKTISIIECFVSFMYQFILLDTLMGTTWHVQWGTKQGDYWIRKISIF